MTRFGFVGLILYLALVVQAIKRAKNVLLSSRVPEEVKRTYVLPVVMLLIILISCLAEDLVPGNGRGNPAVLLAFTLLFFCESIGVKILNKYPATEGIAGEYEQSVSDVGDIPDNVLTAESKRNSLS